MSSFTCGCCGMNHPHQKKRHNLQDRFDLPDEWVQDMDYSKHCNCGLWETYIDAKEGVLDVDAGTLNDLEKAAKRSPVPQPIKDDLTSEKTSLSGF